MKRLQDNLIEFFGLTQMVSGRFWGVWTTVYRAAANRVVQRRQQFSGAGATPPLQWYSALKTLNCKSIEKLLKKKCVTWKKNALGTAFSIALI